MKNSNGVIALIVLVTTQIIIKSIGIESISVQIIVALLAIACSLIIFGTYKYGKKGFGIRYNTIVAILSVVTNISTSGMLIVIRSYPTLADRYGVFLVILSLISFFALCLFIIIYRVFYESKHK